ncbi:MAG: hypothetical protein IJK68_06935 [Muribaculaceae bacterium]|nr:hypothetical protein [Muribaculaceae bacterium]MBR0023968.1 hypothetical protein [Muribaculaceae bacterium]
MASNNNDNKSKLLSAIITLLLGAGIVALLLFTSLHYNYPPLDGEKEAQLLQDTIMFGGEYVDFGDFEDLLNDEPASVEAPSEQQDDESTNDEPQQVGQNDLKDNGSYDEQPQPQVSNKVQESPMKVQEQPPKKLPAEKKTEQPKPEEKPQKKGESKPQPATKKTEQPKSTAPTISEADNKMKKAFGNSAGKGEGKQGNPHGTSGAEKAVGKPGVGGLDGYTLEYFPKAMCPGPGTVVVRVTVSPTGAVTKATVIGGTMTNERARNICLGLAGQSRFRVPVGQTIERTGTLTYTIR